jgi:hypothetical protein
MRRANGEVRGGWRIFRNEDFRDMQVSQNIIPIKKLTMLRVAGYVARTGRQEMHTGF